jgi:hypothetical protein
VAAYRAGGLLSAPQQYMQQRVSWFKTNMTGGTMSALFNISNHYGMSAGNKGGGPPCRTGSDHAIG